MLSRIRHRWLRRLPAIPIAVALVAGAAAAQVGPPAAGQDRNPVIGTVGESSMRAMEVLAPLRPRLEPLAASIGLGEFLQQARPIVAAALRERVIDRLAAEEMEDVISPEQRGQLENYLRQIRDSIVHKNGGTPEAAEAKLRQEKGVGVADLVADSRRDQLVRMLKTARFEGGLVVSGADVERYYSEHLEDFARPGVTMIRRVDVSGAAAADAVAALLASGTPFGEVAGRPENANPRKAREHRLDSVKDDQVIALVRGLKEGDVSDRLDRDGVSTWVEVIRIIPARHLSLDEVKIVAEARLRNETVEKAYAEYGAKLLATGAYTGMDQMTDRLLEAAVRMFVQGS
jgi:hypothetical protein